MLDQRKCLLENRPGREWRWAALALVFGLFVAAAAQVNAQAPEYTQVQALLTRYCAGCHQTSDANGGLAVDTFEHLIKGGDSGHAITPGSAASSRLVQMMRGKLEPAMPPDGEAKPSEDEIQQVADWVEAGAVGPSGKAAIPTRLDVPSISPNRDSQPVTALALTPDEQWLAVARFGKIDILELNTKQPVLEIADLPGKVTAVNFVGGRKYLVAGTGISGLYGEAILIDLATGNVIRRYRGHRDMVYSIAITSDERQLATSGYDGISVLWDLDSETPVREFVGHNGAVLENVFDLSGERLISASADATVKVWRVADGLRLDTRSDPLKEQYTVAISTDGKWIVAGGEDNRIRKWRLVSSDPNQTNPLEISRFAHESAVQLIRCHPDGEHVVSVSSRGVIKVWDLTTLTQRYQFPAQPDSVQALAVGRDRVFVGRMNGSWEMLPWPAESLAIQAVETTSAAASDSGTLPDGEISQVGEREPNDQVNQSLAVVAPFTAQGTIFADDRIDVDLYRFSARRGEQWVIETRASQNQSPLDSHLTVLDADGHPVPRILLQAVRDSYFTFRGKDSRQVDDYRVHNWEEMRLNQLLYCNGEVVRLYHYPRGPDSGFNLYPNFGRRHGMFDTTSVTHALGEPCYIVEPHPPGTHLPETGLPQFLLHYENDDDAQQELGQDSRLTFTAPNDGDYLVRVRDVRDLEGEDFAYELTVRRPKPGFRLLEVGGANPTLIPGGYKKIELTLDRQDEFAGEVQVEVENLPEGVTAAGPIAFESNGLRASFTLFARPDAPPIDQNAADIRVTAVATIGGSEVRSSQSLGKLKFGADSKLAVELLPELQSEARFTEEGFPLLEIQPGGSRMARVRVTRNGYDARVNFGKQDAAINLPFGVYVADTGLNGVLIPPGETERTFLLTAEDWVQPCERLIFLESEEAGKPASNPAMLRVLGKASEAVKNSGAPQ